MDVRRVVTGHDSEGRAIFVSDEAVAPIVPTLLPGNEFHRLWGGDATSHFPDDGSRPSDASYFPPIGGFRFGFFTIPPDGGAGISPDVDINAALVDLEAKLPGLAGHMEPENPGMHTTATIDFEVIVSGTVTLELDDGAMVTLGPGDTVVQNGTRHRWSNAGSEPAVLAVFICGAQHDKVG